MKRPPGGPLRYSMEAEEAEDERGEDAVGGAEEEGAVGGEDAGVEGGDGGHVEVGEGEECKGCAEVDGKHAVDDVEDGVHPSQGVGKGGSVEEVSRRRFFGIF